jgi:hypothetical protein
MHIIHIGEKEKSNYQIRTTDIKEDNKIWNFTDSTKLFQEINANGIKRK